MWVAAEEECTYKTVKVTVEHIYLYLVSTGCMLELHLILVHAILKFVGVVGVWLGIGGLSYNYACVVDGVQRDQVESMCKRKIARSGSLAQITFELSEGYQRSVLPGVSSN